MNARIDGAKRFALLFVINGRSCARCTSYRRRSTPLPRVIVDLLSN